MDLVEILSFLFQLSFSTLGKVSRERAGGQGGKERLWRKMVITTEPPEKARGGGDRLGSDRGCVIAPDGHLFTRTTPWRG